MGVAMHRFMRMERLPVAQRTARVSFRHEVAKSEAEHVLTWAGGTLLALTAVYLAVGGLSLQVFLVHLAEVVVLWIGAFASRRVRARWVPWLTAACAETVAFGFIYENFVEPSSVGMGFLIIVTVALASFILDPVAVVVSSVPVLIGTFVMAASSHPGQAGRWTMAVGSALVMGAVLLRTRLRSLDALGEAVQMNSQLATQDPLSGLLNRRGIEERIPPLLGFATRSQEPLFVGVVDVDGLKEANDLHGHAFGDEVIVAVAAALQQVMRESDLIGRWGGDEFIVIGMGAPLDPDEMAQRVREAIARGPIDRSRWSGDVNIGVGFGSAKNFSLDVAVHEADADMYERRRVRRSGS